MINQRLLLGDEEREYELRKLYQVLLDLQPKLLLLLHLSIMNKPRSSEILHLGPI